MSDVSYFDDGQAPQLPVAAPSDYIELLKPRVMSLVVFTALAGLLMAPVAPHPLIAFASLLSIAVGAGASGALNMWYDADIDAVMSRTSKRPIPSGRLDAASALAFGVVLSILAVLVYLWFRFEWQFAVGAVIATLHDLVLTIGFFAITQIEFNMTSIAAILTIVGYSLNDTVVVFDRIRELLRKYKRMPIAELLDLSINTTLSRTVMTSMTTSLALLALVLFGGSVIKSFSYAMIFGVVIGTYSSIFIAAPVLIYLGARIAAEANETELSNDENAQKVK